MAPVSSHVTTLMGLPGDYTFRDIVKVGVPFSLIMGIGSVILAAWRLPL